MGSSLACSIFCRLRPSISNNHSMHWSRKQCSSEALYIPACFVNWWGLHAESELWRCVHCHSDKRWWEVYSRTGLAPLLGSHLSVTRRPKIFATKYFFSTKWGKRRWKSQMICAYGKSATDLLVLPMSSIWKKVAKIFCGEPTICIRCREQGMLSCADSGRSWIAWIVDRLNLLEV